MNSKNLIGGLLAGAAIGVAIGILLAPASGKDTRKSLAAGSRRLADSLTNSVEESLESLKGRFNMGLDEVTKRGKELINTTNERLKV
jgi:gas vesicle protein